MKKVCAMIGPIVHYINPALSIRELRKAGIDGIMFDYDPFLMSARNLQKLREKMREAERTGQERPKWKPEQYREHYREVEEAFREQDFVPSIAKLPFTDIQIRLEEAAEYEELNSLILQIDRDCIGACEAFGCTHIIVQPLFAGVERGREWEINRKFYLALAKACQRADTKLLLINQCVDRNGHLMRGICSDGAEAARWIDELNREVGAARFGFCLDAGNCNLCGQNIQTMVAELGDRIRAVILTENDGQKGAKLLPFTNAYEHSSTMNWLGLIRGLRELSYDGYLILDGEDTIIAFSPLIRPVLYPLYGAILNYFEMQIQIERDLKKYDHIVLFGAGNMCRNYLKCYGDKYPPLFTCDNNPELWGTRLDGLEVKNPEELKKLPENTGVIICNVFYREIEAQLHSMNISEIGYFNDEYMPSFYFDRLKRIHPDEEEETGKEQADKTEQREN